MSWSTLTLMGSVLPNQTRVTQSLVLVLVVGAHTTSNWLLLHVVSFLAVQPCLGLKGLMVSE